MSWNNFRKEVKYYSTNKEIIPKISTLNPWWITGFYDGESSFIVSIFKNKEYILGYQVQAIYTICLHTKDLILLNKIQSFFLDR